MPDGAGGTGTLVTRQQRVQRRLIANEQEPFGGMTLRRVFQALNDHVGRLVATHGIHGECEGAGHRLV
jgi:hypothetical protein